MGLDDQILSPDERSGAVQGGIFHTCVYSCTGKGLEGPLYMRYSADRCDDERKEP